MPSHRRLTFREEYMMKLELESITKFYGKYPALQNVSAVLTEGVYGPAGAKWSWQDDTDQYFDWNTACQRRRDPSGR